EDQCGGSNTCPPSHERSTACWCWSNRRQLVNRPNVLVARFRRMRLDRHNRFKSQRRLLLGLQVPRREQRRLDAGIRIETVEPNDGLVARLQILRLGDHRLPMALLTRRTDVARSEALERLPGGVPELRPR